MNAQEIFDTAAVGVIRQGRQSANAFGTCVYRGPNGRKCAAGFLLPDEVYDPSMDCDDEETGQGTGWSNLVKRFSSRLPVDLINNSDLIADLQSCHDNASFYSSEFVQDFIREATETARRFKLSTEAMMKVAKELGYA